MAHYEEGQIEFAILSLVQDPLHRLISELATNVRRVAALSARLDAMRPDWHDFTATTDNGEIVSLPNAPDLAYGLTQELLDDAELSDVITQISSSQDVSDVVERRSELITLQAKLRMSIREEMQSDLTDEERATARSQDYGAMMQKMMRKVIMKKAARNFRS